jgi:hypothetical protein
MPDFYFRIRSATKRSTTGATVSLPDHAAARNEAAAIFADFARNVAADLANDPTWQLEVLDRNGVAVFRIKVIAETL